MVRLVKSEVDQSRGALWGRLGFIPCALSYVLVLVAYLIAR